MNRNAIKTAGKSAEVDPKNFSCPECGNAVTHEMEALHCQQCGINYPIANGILDFRRKRHDYYFNPVPKSDMSQLLREASAKPWDETVRGFLQHVRKRSDWIDNLTANRRYAWKLFLELPETGRVLDLGCGLGNLTSNIAPHVAEVVALDLTWERLLFSAERFDKFNRGDRITLVAGGDGNRLPFPDQHFDCVAISGVLEWVADDYPNGDSADSRIKRALLMFASGFGARNPRSIQLRFLKEVRRVLKPHGQVFIAIENRFSYEYFLGRPDHHSNLLYASLLPRMLANIYSIAKSRRPYRTYTHSFGGLRRLLTEAAFASTECYGLIPGYTGLTEVLPTRTSRASWRAPAIASWKERVKSSSYLVPAFGMIGNAHRVPESSFTDRIIERVSREVGARPRDIKINRFQLSSKEKGLLVLHTGQRDVMVKIPFDDRAVSAEANNWKALNMLRSEPVLSSLVPAPIVTDETQGLRFYAESMIPGDSLKDVLAAASRDAWAEAVEALLLRVQSVFSSPGESFSEKCFDELIGDPLRQMKEMGIDSHACDNALRHFREHVKAGDLRLGGTHGDFTVSNIHCSHGKIAGLVDWESASEVGIPAIDALSYLESAQRLLSTGSNIADNFVRLADLDWPCTKEISLLRRIYAESDVDARLHTVLCELAWFRHVSVQLQTDARFDPSFIQTKVAPLFARIS
jgi:ubiquinone/menaquinone biosynthesis C-methylase UbiE